MDSVIDLISTTYVKDEYGVEQPQDRSREVFCKIGPITRAEFSAAGRNGLNPSFVATIWAGDYEGERTVKYDGHGYAVYRTYKPLGSDYIELYCERQGGANGQGQT